MARRKSKSFPSKSEDKPKNTSNVLSDSDESSSDDEYSEDLANLASQVAKEMRNNLSPASTSSARVMNLRNKPVEFIIDDSETQFMIDRSADQEFCKSQVKYRTVNIENEKDELSDNRTVSSKVASSNTEEATESSSDDDDDEEEPQHRTDQPESDGQKNQFERLNLSSALHADMDTDFYVDVDDYKSLKSKAATALKRVDEEIMKKSVLTPDFEKKHAISPYTESARQIKKQRKKEKDLTKGKNWFDMKAPEMTEELKNDLTVLQYRNVLDPKHFYKAPDLKTLPKYFQVGKVVDNPADFYHSRIPKKQRKRTLVDELLADAELRRYNKKKYTEVMMEKAKQTGAYRDIKFSKKLKLKKKKK